MRAATLLLGLLIFCALCWFIAGMLSPDAVGMAVGMLFGVLAGIPTALLMMANNRQRASDDDEQPPVMIVYPPTQQSAPEKFGWPDHIDAEDAHLYSYQLSAYGDSPRRLALPKTEEQKRFRRRVDAGMVRKVPTDTEPRPGCRMLARVDGRIEARP